MRPSASQSSPAAATPNEWSAHVDWGAPKKGPSRFATWIFPLAVAGILGTGAILFSTLVPVPHRIPESLSISVARAGLCQNGGNITTPRDGTFAFSWMTNTSSSETSIDLTPNKGVTIYDSGGTSGTGSVELLAGYVYSFSFCASSLESVLISGTITYGAPLL
jgi:hypothetical protein